MRALAILIAALGLLALAPPAGASFFADDWERKPVRAPAKGKPVRALPAQLVIKPGRYRHAGRRYDMSREGFYRIGSKQRIVYRKRLAALMSGLSWAVGSEGGDDGIATPEAARQLADRRLQLLCGWHVYVAQHVLAEQGIESRHVGALSKGLYGDDNLPAGQLPGMDHVMIEIRVRGRWQLWDVWNNGRPLVDGKPTTAVEWARARDRTLDRIAEDDNHVRWQLSAFYRAAMHTVLIADPSKTWPFYFTDPPSGPDPERRRAIESYRPELIYQPPADFYARWYPGQNPFPNRRGR